MGVDQGRIAVSEDVVLAVRIEDWSACLLVINKEEDEGFTSRRRGAVRVVKIRAMLIRMFGR
jgi:hypothetical protein